MQKQLDEINNGKELNRIQQRQVALDNKNDLRDRHGEADGRDAPRKGSRVAGSGGSNDQILKRRRRSFNGVMKASC